VNGAKRWKKAEPRRQSLYTTELAVNIVSAVQVQVTMSTVNSTVAGNGSKPVKPYPGFPYIPTPPIKVAGT
jgi:hypothetical protein